MNKQRQFNGACIVGDLKTVKALINDPDVDPSVFYNLAIHFAAEYGHKEIVELLMQDPRVDPSDEENWAIRWAAYRGHKDVVELLFTDKHVMDKIEVALKMCKDYGGYDLLKGCVDDYKRKKEKERRVQEAIEEMSADCELYF